MFDTIKGWIFGTAKTVAQAAPAAPSCQFDAVCEATNGTVTVNNLSPALREAMQEANAKEINQALQYTGWISAKTAGIAAAAIGVVLFAFNFHLKNKDKKVPDYLIELIQDTLGKKYVLLLTPFIKAIEKLIGDKADQEFARRRAANPELYDSFEQEDIERIKAQIRSEIKVKTNQMLKIERERILNELEAAKKKSNTTVDPLMPQAKGITAGGCLVNIDVESVIRNISNTYEQANALINNPGGVKLLNN